MASYKIVAEQEATALLRRSDIAPEAHARAAQVLAILALCEAVESVGNAIDSVAADGRLRLEVQVENLGGGAFHVETQE